MLADQLAVTCGLIRIFNLGDACTIGLRQIILAVPNDVLCTCGILQLHAKAVGSSSFPVASKVQVVVPVPFLLVCN